ncbi:hypothetical protein B0H13DRAFT_1851132 [Mycena leptocephala]|nr:hypothetical protein B0H13DRAFT_1851132 [Mycena leptocephala]
MWPTSPIVSLQPSGWFFFVPNWPFEAPIVEHQFELGEWFAHITNEDSATSKKVLIDHGLIVLCSPEDVLVRVGDDVDGYGTPAAGDAVADGLDDLAPAELDVGDEEGTCRGAVSAVVPRCPALVALPGPDSDGARGEQVGALLAWLERPMLLRIRGDLLRVRRECCCIAGVDDHRRRLDHPEAIDVGAIATRRRRGRCRCLREEKHLDFKWIALILYGIATMYILKSMTVLPPVTF